MNVGYSCTVELGLVVKESSATRDLILVRTVPALDLVGA